MNAEVKAALKCLDRAVSAFIEQEGLLLSDFLPELIEHHPYLAAHLVRGLASTRHVQDQSPRDFPSHKRNENMNAHNQQAKHPGSQSSKRHRRDNRQPDKKEFDRAFVLAAKDILSKPLFDKLVTAALNKTGPSER